MNGVDISLLVMSMTYAGLVSIGAALIWASQERLREWGWACKEAGAPERGICALTCKKPRVVSVFLVASSASGLVAWPWLATVQRAGVLLFLLFLMACCFALSMWSLTCQFEDGDDDDDGRGGFDGFDDDPDGGGGLELEFDESAFNQVRSQWEQTAPALSNR